MPDKRHAHGILFGIATSIVTSFSELYYYTSTLTRVSTRKAPPFSFSYSLILRNSLPRYVPVDTMPLAARPLRYRLFTTHSRAVRGCRCTNAYLCLQAVRGLHKRVRDGGPMLGHRGFKERIRINAPVTPVTPSLNPTSFFVHQALYHP